MLKPIELAALVAGCDFDIEVTEEGKLFLFDLQGANLGGIENQEFETYESVLERMSTYLDDYYFNPLCECIFEDFGEWLGDLTYKEVADWCDVNAPSWAVDLRRICEAVD